MGTCLLESTFIRVRIIIHIYLPPKACLKLVPSYQEKKNLVLQRQTNKIIKTKTKQNYKNFLGFFLTTTYSNQWSFELIPGVLFGIFQRILCLLFFKIWGIRLKSCPVRVQLKFWFLFYIPFIFFGGFQRVAYYRCIYVSVFPKRYASI